MKKALPYIAGVAICFLLGFAASRLQSDALANWYPYLNKPQLTPPNSVFPITWGIIYLLSGISFGLVWNSAGPLRKRLLKLWGVQQFFNFTWSIMFFTLQNPLAGLLNIVILDIVVLIYILQAWKVNRAASVMFWPYMAWISFATYLNAYIMIYN